MSCSKLLVLAAGAAVMLSAGAVEARQQAMVPLGMDEVNPSWVAPAFLEEAPGAVVPTPAPPAAVAATPRPDPGAPKSPEPTAGKSLDESSADEESAESADEEEESSVENADEESESGQTEDVTEESTEEATEESGGADEVVEESESESESSSADSREISPVDGTMAGHVWVKADNDETNDHQPAARETHKPPVELLPKKKALERTPDTLKNIAAAQAKEDAAKDAKDNKALSVRTAEKQQKEAAESKADADATAKAGAAAATAKATVSGPAAAKAAEAAAAKNPVVVAVDPSKVAASTQAIKKVIASEEKPTELKPKAEKVETGGQVPSAAAKKEVDPTPAATTAAVPAAKK